MRLKPDLAADHAAEAGTAAGPAAADLALQKQVAVFVADGHATAAAITLVVGVERAGEPGGGGAGVGIGKADGLHWISKEVVVRGSKGGYDIPIENIFILFFVCVYYIIANPHYTH